MIPPHEPCAASALLFPTLQITEALVGKIVGNRPQMILELQLYQ